MKEASEGSLSGILEYTDEVVLDFIHCAASSIFDAGSGMGLSDTFSNLFLGTIMSVDIVTDGIGQNFEICLIGFYPYSRTL